MSGRDEPSYGEQELVDQELDALMEVLERREPIDTAAPGHVPWCRCSACWPIGRKWDQPRDPFDPGFVPVVRPIDPNEVMVFEKGEPEIDPTDGTPSPDSVTLAFRDLRLAVERVWAQVRLGAAPLDEALKRAGIDLGRPPEPPSLLGDENPPTHSTVLSELLAFQREERRTIIDRFTKAQQAELHPIDGDLKKLIDAIDPSGELDNLHDLLELATEMRGFWDTH